MVTVAKLALKTAAGLDLGGVHLTVDGQPAGVLGVQDKSVLGALPAVDLQGIATVPGKHTLVVTAAAGLAPDAPQVGDLSAIDRQKLVDVLLYVEYHVGP